MQYTTAYHSPAGKIFLSADGIGLTGLWFEGGKYHIPRLNPKHEERETPVFTEVRRWLDTYFTGQEPDFMPPIHIIGTPFQKEVWDILMQIPYGQTTTYGAIAKQIAARRGVSRMSAQAVGGAVGRNPLSIMVPCHRVVGSDGSLTGYSGGLDKKEFLLRLESAYQ